MSQDNNTKDDHHHSGEDAELREQKLERNEKLLAAAEEGNVDLVTRLLAEGAEVEYKDEDGYTAAHNAAYGGHNAPPLTIAGQGSNGQYKRRRV